MADETHPQQIFGPVLGGGGGSAQLMHGVPAWLMHGVLHGLQHSDSQTRTSQSATHSSEEVQNSMFSEAITIDDRPRAI